MRETRVVQGLPSPVSGQVRHWLVVLRRPLCVLLACGFLVSHQPAALGMLQALLEQRFGHGAPDALERVKGIVVLGGSDDRLREAARLASAHPGLRLFVSGAGEPAYIRAVMGGAIPGERIEFENVSKTTYQNALQSRTAIMPQPGEKWLLVTSTYHLPRAVGAFRKLGFAVEPWPVRDLSGSPTQQAAVIRHELLGLLWYWLAGRSSELFPALSPSR